MGGDCPPGIPVFESYVGVFYRESMPPTGQSPATMSVISLAPGGLRSASLI